MIEENFQPSKLKEFYIQNLFYKYNYNIPLNDEHITIIHGLNGSGKTTIFKILNSFFKQEFNTLFFIPFDFFEIIFENNISIRVYANRFLFEKNCVEDKRYFDFLNKEFYDEAIYERPKSKEGSLNATRSRRYGDYDHFQNKMREREKLLELIFEIKYNSESQKNMTVFEYSVTSDKYFLSNGTWKRIDPSKSKFKTALKDKIIEYLKCYSAEFFPRQFYPNPFIAFYEPDNYPDDIDELNLLIENIENNLVFNEEAGKKDPDPQLLVKLYNLKKHRKKIAAEKESKPKISFSSVGDLLFQMLRVEREIHFIESQRLFRIYSNDYAIRQLKKDAQHLKELIKKAYEESDLELRNFNKEFINQFMSGLNNINEDNQASSNIKNQLIIKMDQVFRTETFQENVLGLYNKELSDDERKTKSNNFSKALKEFHYKNGAVTRELSTEKVEVYLERLGIFNKENGGTRVKWEKPEIRLAIEIYMAGRENALKPFSNLTAKCTELFKIVTENFDHKFVMFNPEMGMLFFDLELLAKKPHYKDVHGNEGRSGYKLDPEFLSSGEQHLLIIIYNILFRIPDNSIILIDEPEISLHVSWQIKFVEILKEILKLEDKKNIQILIATHSPQIINGRWDLTIGLGAIE